MRKNNRLYDSNLIKFDSISRESEAGSRKSEVGSRNSEVGSGKSEVPPRDFRNFSLVTWPALQ